MNRPTRHRRPRSLALVVLGIVGLSALVLGPDGSLGFLGVAAGQVSRVLGAAFVPQSAQVDFRAVAGSNSNINGVLEPGETVQVAPSWTNTTGGPLPSTGTASDLTGPAGPTYAIDDATADYGTAGAGATVDCNSATGDCYLMTVSGARPVAHWDATFLETLSPTKIANTWTTHIGRTFTDVPTTNPFYFYVESLVHSGVTGGCGTELYCPSSPVTRAQMAVFLLKAKFGADHIPPPATGTVFADVPIDAFAAAWIEELAALQITGGCGGGNYCPNGLVTRAQMAVFLLKTEHGSAYLPPDCTGLFGDVPCPSQFAAWIEQLFNEGITGGCGGGNYCPDAAELPRTDGRVPGQDHEPPRPSPADPDAHGHADADRDGHVHLDADADVQPDSDGRPARPRSPARSRRLAPRRSRARPRRRTRRRALPP